MYMPAKFIFSEDWSTANRAQSWLKEVEQYGKNSYVLGILNLIEGCKPRRVFDVGCGNGFPFASSLLEKNIEVHGCDPSLSLLKEATRQYPALRWYHTGYEHMVEKINGARYDVVYCLRSTWLFPNIISALGNMLEITKPGGIIIFDIMNSDSPEISKFIKTMRKKKYRTFFKNIVKLVLNTVVRTSYSYASGIDKNYPVSPNQVDTFLIRKKFLFKKFTFSQMSGENTSYDPLAFRILYCVQVPENI